MKTKFTYLLVVITIAIVGTYFLSQKKEASNIESIRKQVASDIKDFKQRGQVGIVRVVPYNGKRTFEDPSPEERIIAVEMVISPRDVTIDPDDLAIHDKNGKFLNYGWPEVYLDDKYRA